MRKRKKNTISIMLLLLLICLGIGYAYLTTTLSINGTSNITAANWDVHWANIQVKTGSVNASTPTISNQTTVSYSVILNTPGDYYEFTVDAVNGGSIDAMIDTIDSKLNGVTITTLPDYLNYTVTYSDGGALQSNHQLLANTIETYKVRIEYRTDIESNQLPTTNQTLNLQFTATYSQANENAQEVDHGAMVYVISPTSSYIGQAIPSDITQYSSASEAMAAFSNRPFYLKHLTRNSIVEESYVEFIITSTMAQANPGMTAGTYAIRGLDTHDESATSTNNCKAEYYDSSTGECLSPYYATNKETLLRAFGSPYCTDSFSNFYCAVSGLGVTVVESGYAYVGDDDMFCGVLIDGSSSCTIY